MADLPTPQSYEQILSDMLSAYAAKIGINDFNTGSAITSFFEVVALATARSSGDVFQILKDYSVDRATGDALKRLATEYNVTPIAARVTTGAVNVIDISFTKIASKIYSGANPPNIGSTMINVSDASLFPATGSLYIGRGTPNVEGPIPYTAKSQTGGYWVVTLSTPTTKFHNLGEAVIVAQGGNRAIPANTVAISPSVGASPNIQYSVTTQAVVLDGETEVDGVPVTALNPGSSGNVPAGAVKSFATPPFTGATVTNPLPFTTGADSETDDQLRVRIKNALASTGLGTATAVKAALIGATPSDENATIVSDSLQVNTDGSATVFVDDGSGYEAKSAGVGLESIVDDALGGEQFFPLQTGGRQAPVAKAFLQSTLSAPFDLVGGDTLSLIIGGVVYSHTFATSDFRSPGGATAFEVTASVNGDTALGFEATTAGGGIYVVFRAKAETHDSIQTTVPTTTSGRDASVQMGLPSNLVETLRLYKNNVPLSKDGSTASIFSQAQALWSATIANGDTLILAVDGTQSITYTILNADFIATGLYTSVASTNSLASWAQVLNAKLTGVTVTVVGQQLEITSNLGAANRAEVVVDPSSTLVSKGIFTSTLGLSSQGAASDFTLDRNTAQFELVTPLVAGDVLSAGTIQTEGMVTSSAISGGSITFGSLAHIWILIDAPGTIIPTGVSGNSTLTVSAVSPDTIRYTSNVSGAFVNVLPGDYLINWSAEMPSNSDRIEGRVHAVTGTTLDVVITPAEYAAIVPGNAVYLAGFVILRAINAPQKFEIPSGTLTLDQIAAALQAQTSNLIFSVSQEQFVSVATTTMDTTGSVLIVTADTQGQLLGLPINAIDDSKDSLIAFYDSGDYEAEFPLFIHSTFSGGASANPIDSYITQVNTTASLAGRDPNELIAILHPYGAVRDAQPYLEHTQETAIDSTGMIIGVVGESDIRRVRGTDGPIADRFFIANPLDFGYNDTAVVVLDNNPSGESFTIPFYRRAITNTGYVSNPYNWDAYDVDSGANASFATAFPGFNFSNFKAFMQAKKVLKPTPAQTAILYRSKPWGRSGEKITVGYVYPSGPNQAISSTVVVGTTVDVRISLASGTSVTSSVVASTQWNVTITPNTPSAGIDQVTYTWNGTGTNPALALAGGEYVNILPSSGFNPANDGIFRVSTQGGFTPTATSFSVQRPTGSAVAEINAVTGVNGAMTFYNVTPTTAAAVVAYVNANIPQYVSATLVNDGGMTGAGVIVLSTYEDSGFTMQAVQLKDGINWILSNNVSGTGATPQFVFKTPLQLPTDVGYAFNNGEEVRLIPTTMDQVRRLVSVLAVTGFTTVGNVNLVDRSERIEFSTQILGSSGAIQIIGGTGNEYATPILDSGERFDNTYMTASVDSVAGQGIQSDQWFRLQATKTQSKAAGFSSGTSVTTVNNTPLSNETTITMSGRTLTQRFFGRPRSNVRIQGNTFRVEKQGELVCISWNGNGTSPAFEAAVTFNASSGTLNIVKVSGTSDSQIVILTGTTNFTGMNIGDIITINLPSGGVNNGTFLVTGVSEDGKTIQYTNVNAQNVFNSGSFTFTGNSTPGDIFSVNGTNFTAGTDFPIGGTSQITAANLAATIAALPQITVTASGNVVTVQGTFVNQTITLGYTGSSVVNVTNPVAAGEAYTNTSFAATSGVSEGDTVFFTAPFNVLNQGRFRVIRQYNDSIWIENANVFEEEVVCVANPISLGYDSTTSFKVNAANNGMYINWNGIGTEPHLENAAMGDVVTLGTDFSSGNQGSFMVSQSGAALAQIAQITLPTGAQLTPTGVGQYWTFQSAGNITTYFVWYSVTGGSNTAPTVAGATAIPVVVLGSDSAAIVAAKTVTAINAVASADASASALNAIVTLTLIGKTATNSPVNVTMPAPFAILVTQSGRTTFMKLINPAAVSQSTVFVTNVLSNNRPQIIFSEYEATVPGDLFTVTGSVLGASNAGNYTVVKTLSRESIVVTNNLANVTNVSLNGNETAIFVEEGVAYSGYKQVFLVASQPGTTTRNELLFNTNANYAKINEAAGVAMTSIGKMNFPTVIRNGLDSYRYNTGLIAEANRIIYGDPRDPITYPGVGAAGADIFVREPLAYRIQVSVDIRLLTGAPFNNVSQQVRSSVSSLINSNPVGQSIDISSIVSVVRAVPGIQSVAISSPQYDATHDLITLVPGQKAIIIDPTTDISVDQIGT